MGYHMEYSPQSESSNSKWNLAFYVCPYFSPLPLHLGMSSCLLSSTVLQIHTIVVGFAVIYLAVISSSVFKFLHIAILSILAIVDRPRVLMSSCHLSSVFLQNQTINVRVGKGSSD